MNVFDGLISPKIDLTLKTKNLYHLLQDLVYNEASFCFELIKINVKKFLMFIIFTISKKLNQNYNELRDNEFLN